jgi:anti-anti-sigma factor
VTTARDHACHLIESDAEHSLCPCSRRVNAPTLSHRLQIPGRPQGGSEEHELKRSPRRVSVPSPRPGSTINRKAAQLHLDGSRSILLFHGDLDLATAHTVRNGLVDACRDTSGEVIVDLSDVSFFDAVTVGLFATANDRLNQTGRRLTLLGLSPHQERVLRVCGLHHLLAVAVCTPSGRPSGARRAMS